jgi:hypothetical protein
MSMHLISSNATIEAIKENDKRTRLSDGKELYLRLFVKGGSHAWRFDYSLEGRRKTPSFGTCRTTTLALARKRRVRQAVKRARSRAA